MPTKQSSLNLDYSPSTVANTHVSREEFNEVRDTVATLTRDVAGLVELHRAVSHDTAEIKKQQTNHDTKLDAIRDEVISKRAEGFTGGQIATSLFVLFGVFSIVGTLLVQHTAGAIEPIKGDIAAITAQLQQNDDAQTSEIDVKLKWLSDVLNLQVDYLRAETNEGYVPSYVPLRSIGATDLRDLPRPKVTPE